MFHNGINNLFVKQQNYIFKLNKLRFKCFCH